MAQRKNICPDCGTKMQSIKLIDATHPGFGGQEGTRHVELCYAAADSTPSLFFGKIKKLGRVRGQICPECGRIMLHGSGVGMV